MTRWKGGRGAMFRRLGRLSAAVAFAALPGCGDATTPDHGGSYVATVVPRSGQVDGAAVIELAGKGVAAVTQLGGRLFVEQLAGDLTRVVIVNDVAGPLEFRLEVAPGSDMPRATLIEVADTADMLRSSLDGYRVSVRR